MNEGSTLCGDAAPAPAADPAAAPAADPAAAPVAAPVASTAPRAAAALTRRREVLAGVRMSLAAGLGMFPIGVAFGLLVVQTGLPWWVAPGLSILVFAGSAELLLVGLMAAATPLATIALTTLLVNFRHVFYAFSFPLHVVRHPLARLYSVYALIDEAYAVTAATPRGWSAPRLIAMQLSFQSYWVGGGLVGVGLGAVIPGRIEGLDFALCALFITLTLDACRSRREIPSLLLAALSFSIALLVAPHDALFLGLLGFLVLLAVRFLLTRRTAPIAQPDAPPLAAPAAAPDPSITADAADAPADPQEADRA
ncbi:AzlC family ABC transporter permease [Brachybacterium phenoliresistens]|uniref:AzlC family ABC transporter permease n=1 Tax=Brachybacterium phenoliresistens TaxID=396014 RepID=UPI0031DD9B03